MVGEGIIEWFLTSKFIWVSGGSLCFPLKNCKSFMVEKKLFHRYIPQKGREKVPPHIKTYTRCKGDNAAWFIVSSSNLSKGSIKITWLT